MTTSTFSQRFKQGRRCSFLSDEQARRNGLYPAVGIDFRALSPLKWQHLNPYGTFTLNMQERLSLESR